MTYEVYAMFREGTYHIATSTNRDHGLDVAERVCKNLGVWPMGFLSGTTGELKIAGPIFTFNDLKARSK